MRITIKMTSVLFDALQRDLRRPHAFAAERVAFLKTRVGTMPGGIVLLPLEIVAVPDECYVPAPGVGAAIGEEMLRNALQIARTERVAMIHVHLHDHVGRPAFSIVDREETARFMPSFAYVQPELPHAAIVLSRDGLVGRCWRKGSRPDAIHEIAIVGSTVRRFICA